MIPVITASIKPRIILSEEKTIVSQKLMLRIKFMIAGNTASGAAKSVSWFMILLTISQKKSQKHTARILYLYL
jgi:hypothetical protein